MPKQQKETQRFTKTIDFILCWLITSGHGDHSEVLLLYQWPLLGKNKFYCFSGYQLLIASWLWIRTMSTSILQYWDFIWLEIVQVFCITPIMQVFCITPQSLCVSMCTNPYVPGSYCFLVLNTLSGSYNLSAFCFHKPWILEASALTETSC